MISLIKIPNSNLRDLVSHWKSLFHYVNVHTSIAILTECHDVKVQVDRAPHWVQDDRRVSQSGGGTLQWTSEDLRYSSDSLANCLTLSTPFSC